MASNPYFPIPLWIIGPRIKPKTAPNAPKAKQNPNMNARHSLETLLLKIIKFIMKMLNKVITVPVKPIVLKTRNILLYPCKMNKIKEKTTETYKLISVGHGENVSDLIPVNNTVGINIMQRIAPKNRT
jgi:hypothetical protein